MSHKRPVRLQHHVGLLSTLLTAKQLHEAYQTLVESLLWCCYVSCSVQLHQWSRTVSAS